MLLEYLQPLPPLARITMCSSIFLLMGTAVERYLAVCRPHHYRSVSQEAQHLIALLPAGAIQAWPVHLLHPAQSVRCASHECAKVNTPQSFQGIDIIFISIIINTLK